MNSTLRAFPAIQNPFLLIPLVCASQAIPFVQITFLLSSAWSLEISFLLFSNLANKEGIKEKSEYLMKNVSFLYFFFSHSHNVTIKRHVTRKRKEAEKKLILIGFLKLDYELLTWVQSVQKT